MLKQSAVLSPEDRELLSLYHHSFDDEKVDIDLILCLLHKIHASPQEGGRALINFDGEGASTI